MHSNKKVWLVTGASSGFGRAVTEVALRLGDSVVATVRNNDTESPLADLTEQYPTQLLVVAVDVRHPNEITAAFEQARQKFQRVDIVFNNAGYCIISEAEGMSDEHGRDMFEVLFWGAVNVTKEAVKVFRDVNNPPGGRLLQMSSRAALKVVPGVAHYAAAYVNETCTPRSLHLTSAQKTLERFSEGLATELDPSWNIKISIIQPALFRTNAPLTNAVEPVHPAYTDPNLPTRKIRNIYPGEQAARASDGDPQKLALVMHELAYMDDPPLYLPLHRVALRAAKEKGEELIEAVDKYAHWSDDVYFDANRD